MTKHTNKSREARRIQSKSGVKYTEALASLDPKNRISFGIDPQMFSPAGLDFHEELRKVISYSGNSVNGLRVVGKNKGGSKPISAFALEVERGASPYLITIAHEHNINAITDFACLVYPESRREEIHQAVKDSADSIDNDEFFGILYYGVTIDGLDSKAETKLKVDDLPQAQVQYVAIAASENVENSTILGIYTNRNQAEREGQIKLDALIEKSYESGGSFYEPNLEILELREDGEESTEDVKLNPRKNG